MPAKIKCYRRTSYDDPPKRSPSDPAHATVEKVAALEAMLPLSFWMRRVDERLGQLEASIAKLARGAAEGGAE